MHRYLIYLIIKSIWLLKSITKSVSTLFELKKWNYQFIAKYLILVSLTATVLIFNPFNNYIDSNSQLTPPVVENENIQCHFPQLSLDNNDLSFTISKPIRLVCRSWFYPIEIDNYSLRLIAPHINCSVVFYLGEGDAKYQTITIRLIRNVTISLLSDYFTIICEDPKKKHFYPSLPYASIHYNSTILKRLSKRNKRKEDHFNIVIVGLDSVSRLQFERMLPLTFDYITNTMNGIVLKGYNILGDGTPQQLIPMLTGFKETELPSTLRSNANASFVDIYPFIWNKYREHGYVTGYAEDRPEYGIWTFRLKGFKRTPTDHYLSPFYNMKTTRSLLFRRNAHCLRNQTTFDVFLSYINQFWSSYSQYKKFFFAFFKQYTHDGYKYGSVLDLSLLNFLKGFNQEIDNEKTIIIIMTDHGARFSAARQTPQGKLEERLPFMSFVFPKLFQIKYSTALRNLKTNINRLTTPFDIHSTLLSLLDMNQINYTTNVDQKQRNISLFHVIPAQRTCDDLNLEPHWCSCLQWENIDVNNTKIHDAAKHIVSHINKELSLVTNTLCAQLQLNSIHNAQMYRPNRALLKFSGSSDINGRVPKYEDRKSDIRFYQIMFDTKPNQAIYEATTQYSGKAGSFSTDLNHISRLNAYKSSASCIETSYSHLRKFCQCIQ